MFDGGRHTQNNILRFMQTSLHLLIFVAICSLNLVFLEVLANCTAVPGANFAAIQVYQNTACSGVAWVEGKFPEGSCTFFGNFNVYVSPFCTVNGSVGVYSDTQCTVPTTTLCHGTSCVLETWQYYNCQSIPCILEPAQNFSTITTCIVPK